MLLQIICAGCGKFMGTKEAQNAPLPISHSICKECSRKIEKETEEFLNSLNNKGN